MVVSKKRKISKTTLKVDFSVLIQHLLDFLVIENYSLRLQINCQEPNRHLLDYPLPASLLLELLTVLNNLQLSILLMYVKQHTNDDRPKHNILIWRVLDPVLLQIKDPSKSIRCKHGNDKHLLKKVH